MDHSGSGGTRCIVDLSCATQVVFLPVCGDCYCFEVDECGGIQESFERVQQISYVFMLTCWLYFRL